jgi:surfeit locus 1 family protein
MHSVSRLKSEAILVWGAGLLLCAVLVGLGFWQLMRADEKKTLIELLEIRRQQAPIRLDGSAADLETLLYRRVQVSGVYDFAHQFLLDNQVVQGQTGAYVLTPLRLAGSPRAVLVNRGWMPMVNRRIAESDLNIPEPEVYIEGIVNRFPGVGFRFDGAEVPSHGWPGLIQLVDPGYLSSILGYPLSSFQILLNPNIQPGFYREWKITYPVSPEKHLAYAVQWFALSAVPAAMLVLRRRRSHD